MKKIAWVVLALFLFSCNQTKIAYVDVEQVMNDYKERQELEAEFKSRQEKMAKKLDSMQIAFQGKVQEYYKSAKRMSANKRKQVEQSLQQEQQVLQTKGQKMAQEFQKESGEKSDALTKKVDSFITDYAKKNKLNLVIGTQGKGAVMYGDNNLNISKQILEILNNNYTKK